MPIIRGAHPPSEGGATMIRSLISALGISTVLCISTVLAGSAPPGGGPALQWPLEMTKDGNRLTIYQPQIDEWQDHRILKGRCAVEEQGKGAEPVAGAVWLEA